MLCSGQNDAHELVALILELQSVKHVTNIDFHVFTASQYNQPGQLPTKEIVNWILENSSSKEKEKNLYVHIYDIQNLGEMLELFKEVIVFISAPHSQFIF